MEIGHRCSHDAGICSGYFRMYPETVDGKKAKSEAARAHVTGESR